MLCYQCERQVLELNKNSRCLECVTQVNDFNLRENQDLRIKISKIIDAMNEQFIVRHIDSLFAISDFDGDEDVDFRKEIEKFVNLVSEWDCSLAVYNKTNLQVEGDYMKYKSLFVAAMKYINSIGNEFDQAESWTALKNAALAAGVDRDGN